MCTYTSWCMVNMVLKIRTDQVLGFLQCNRPLPPNHSAAQCTHMSVCERLVGPSNHSSHGSHDFICALLSKSDVRSFLLRGSTHFFVDSDSASGKGDATSYSSPRTHSHSRAVSCRVVHVSGARVVVSILIDEKLSDSARFSR